MITTNNTTSIFSHLLSIATQVCTPKFAHPHLVHMGEHRRFTKRLAAPTSRYHLPQRGQLLQDATPQHKLLHSVAAIATNKPTIDIVMRHGGPLITCKVIVRPLTFLTLALVGNVASCYHYTHSQRSIPSLSPLLISIQVIIRRPLCVCECAHTSDRPGAHCKCADTPGTPRCSPF